MCPIPLPEEDFLEAERQPVATLQLKGSNLGVTQVEYARSKRNGVGESETSCLFPLPEQAAGRSCFSVIRAAMVMEISFVL